MFKQLVWIVFFLLVVQGILTFFQIKDYKKNADELIKKGRIGVGNAKRRFSAGAIVLLTADDNEVVVEGRIMEGVSVFAKFKDFPNYNGSKLSTIMAETHEKISSTQGIEKARASATYQAASMIYDVFRAERGEETKEDISQFVGEEIVDAQITQENVNAKDQEPDVFEEFSDFEEFAEPEIIDVEPLADNQGKVKDPQNHQ